MLNALEKVYDVNNERKKLLESYVRMIKKSQESLNLIGRSTISNIWERHIIDSIQILNHLPKEKKNSFLLDVGTGAGLPGIVLAIMGRHDVILCEKSPKKSNFLKKVQKELSLNYIVHNRRIEDIIIKNVSIIVSRAYASISKLILSNLHLISKETILVIHKGKKYMEEIKDAKKNFFFSYKKFKSITSNESVILKIENIEKR